LIAQGHSHQEIATKLSLDVARVHVIPCGGCVEGRRVEPRSDRALRGEARMASALVVVTLSLISQARLSEEVASSNDRGM
jgi:hypothetical protein